MKNSDLIKYFIDQVELKGYSTDWLWELQIQEHIQDERYQNELYLCIQDEYNLEPPTHLVYLTEYDESTDETLDTGDDGLYSIKDDYYQLDLHLSSKEKIDVFLKDRFKKFNNNKGKRLKSY